MKYAVQMYSLRGQISGGDDMLDILGKVKEIGYDGVEFAGFAGLDAKTLKARLDELGLVCVGAHVGLGDLEADKLGATLDAAEILGMPQIGIGGADTSTEEALSHVVAVMGEAEKEAEKRGLKIYFHTHTGEFVPPEGAAVPGTIIERIMGACYAQIDTYWSFHAGIDTNAFLAEHRDRLVTVHLKDGNDGTPAALGEGQNDVTSIIACCEKLGIEWGVVENDDPVPDGLSDITRSMAFLNKLKS